MSVTLILLPIALAAAAAAGGAGALGAVLTAKGSDSAGTAPAAVRVRTRMKDSTLLSNALTNLGATNITVSATRVTAETVIDGASLTMTLTDDGVWEAHVEGLDGTEITVATATELLQRLDGEYAAMVQQAVAEKIRLRAESSGFDLVSETREADDTVTMVLNVRTDA
jgi:hypothetical protein